VSGSFLEKKSGKGSKGGLSKGVEEGNGGKAIFSATFRTGKRGQKGTLIRLGEKREPREQSAGQ